MSGRNWTLLASILLLAAAALPAYWLQREQIYQFQQRHEQYRDSLYLPSSEYIRAISLGYDQFVADFLWLRMIQSFAAGWSRPENAEQMMNYVRVITDLDPHFEDVYSLAIMAIGEKSNRYDLVKEVADLAYLNNPARYRLPYEAAYHASWFQDDQRQAKFYIRLALLDEQAPEYVARWIPHFDAKDGRYRSGYEFSLQHYIMALASRTDRINEDADLRSSRMKLYRVVDDWIRTVIEPEVKAWHEERGEWPTVEQLDEAGRFSGAELPDFTQVHHVLEGLRYGRVDVPGTEELDRFIRSTIATVDRLPPSPFSFVPPHYQGYVVWPDSPLPTGIIISRAEGVFQIRQIITFIESMAWEYKANKGETPQRLEDFATQFVGMRDPFGGRFVWDPQAEKASSTSFPDLGPDVVPDLY